MVHVLKNDPNNDSTASGRLNQIGVNAAFLQDIKDDERHVLATLNSVKQQLNRRTLDPPDPSSTRANLRRLYAQVKRRFELESICGYMENVIHVAPRLCRQSEELLNEHTVLLDQLRSIVEIAHQECQEEGDAPMNSNSLRAAFMSFHVQFLAHEERETDLIIDSLYFDIGGGD